MYIIGLTGGIGSGKSTVASALRDLGAAVIDADKLAREIVEPGEPAFHDIVRVFGPRVVDKDGRLDRKKLGELVFNNQEYIAELNRITHPRVSERFEQQMRSLPSGTRIVVWDVPLLIESGMYRDVDAVWLVWVDASTQLQRLMDRDHCTEQEALSRIRSQMDLTEKKKLADRLIDNTGSIAETISVVTRFYNQLLRILESQPI
jgi:dephospho-CoA kinase